MSNSIDRIAPTHRPTGPAAGTQTWKQLLFCHWRVEPDVIGPLLPAGLELDLFDDRAYVGIVPFQMRNIRPSWLPHRLAFNFLETNLRTYVVHQGRPGVYFFSLDANSWPAVIAARLGWSLPYHHASMTDAQSDDTVEYQSRRAGGKAIHQVRFSPQTRLGPSPPGTLEHFLFERYLLFVEKRGVIQVGQVHHSPYEVWTAKVEHLEEGLFEAADLPASGRAPDLTHYSPGVDVEVFAIRPTNH